MASGDLDDPPVDGWSGVLEVASTTSAIAIARKRIGTWLGTIDPQERDWHNALVVASELISNAVEHGDGEMSMVRFGLADGAVRLRVTSRMPAAAALAPVAEWGLPDRLAARGRGLGIVAALANSISVDRTARYVTITVDVAAG